MMPLNCCTLSRVLLVFNENWFPKMLSKQKNIVSLLFPFLKIKAKQKYITSIIVYQILQGKVFLIFLKTWLLNDALSFKRCIIKNLFYKCYFNNENGDIFKKPITMFINDFSLSLKMERLWVLFLFYWATFSRKSWNETALFYLPYL